VCYLVNKTGVNVLFLMYNGVSWFYKHNNPRIPMKRSFFRIRIPSGQNKGFSLIELSVVVSVAATALVGFLSWTQPKTSTDSGLAIVTSNKMRDIKSAIDSFRVQRKRLPCPADQLMRSDGTKVPATGAITANFGTEALNKSTSPATCASSLGAIPVYSLGLDESYMNDGWGRRFTYQVADSICGSSACDIASYKNGTGNIKVVTSTTSGTTITTSAAYILASHGSNGSGAYLPSGQRLADGTGNELQNSVGYTTYGKTYVMANPSSSFDDILVFSTKNLLESVTNKNSTYGISVVDCEANSQALASFTLNETANMQTSLASLTDLITNGAVNADQGLLGILKATQSICVAYYGAGDSVTAKTISGKVWRGGQCPGNSNPSVNGATYYAATDTCTCSSGLWDGNCTPQAPFINGLKLWLDAADAGALYTGSDCKTGSRPINGASIGCWQDKSGNGNNATQSTVANQPTYVTGAQNGNSALSFDGSSDYFSLPDYIIADGNIPYTVYIVAKENATTNTSGGTNNYNGLLKFGTSSSAGQELAFRFHPSNYIFDYWWSSGDLPTNNGTIAIQTPYIFTFKYDTSAGKSIYINGTLSKSSGSVGRNGLNSGQGRVGLTLLSPPYDEHLNGSIYEINVYNIAFTAAQITSVYTYLRTKWGL